MLIFLLLNMLVLSGAFLMACRFLEIKGAVDSIIALFAVYLAQIVFIELLLGVSTVLCLKNVILLAVAFFLAAYLLAKNRQGARQPLNFSLYFEKLLSNKLLSLVFSIAVSFAAVKIVVNLLNPPFGWDSLNYHFTFPVEWLKHGNLNTPITVFDDPSPTYYPINGSLFYLWLIMPFSSVFLADLGQLPFFIIAVISVYGISRKIGLNKKNSFFGALLFALIPNFFKQLQIAYVDIMVAALFLACVNYLLILRKEFSQRNVFIYSLSLGLLIGTKTTALPFSILLIIPFLAGLAKSDKKIRFGLVFMFCILVFGGFSYLRNFIQTANPVYPLDFKLFNLHIFKGVLDKSVYASHFTGSDYSLGKMLFHEGLGAQALFLILPGIFLALPVTFIKNKRKLDFNFSYFLLLPIFIYIVYRYIVPLANVRYLYAMMGLGVILGFYLLELLKAKRWLISVLVIVCVLSSVPSLAKRQELVSAIILSAALFLILINSGKISWFRRNRVFWAMIIALATSLLFWAKGFYSANEFPRYYKMARYSGFWPDAAKAWDWLNINSVGNNIAYTGRAVPFPLYGSGLKNNVYYVSVNKTQPAKLHYFSGSKYEYCPGFESLSKAINQGNNYRGNADYDVWLSNLLQANTDYLFVYSLQQTKDTIFPVEDAWAIAHPDKFNPVFSNKTIHIYKVAK
ncbi:MAG: hypothetical protein V1869_01305 [Candidatus Omnitrophota bacterium]